MNLNELEVKGPGSGASEGQAGKKLYTGLLPIQIKLVNPTEKQLAEFYGVEESKIKEVSYIRERDGESTTRLDFYYENHPSSKHSIKSKFSIFIRKETRQSKAGKKQYIDDFTRTSWAMNLSELSQNQEQVKDFMRLDMSTAREAFPGEETIYNLLKAYGNIIPRNKPLKLTHTDNLFVADGSELQKFFDFFNNKDGGMLAMLGVKDYKYQEVFTGHFMPLHSKLSDYDKRQIEGDYGFKAYFAGYVLSEYVPEAAPEVDEEESLFSSGSNSLKSNVDVEDENPFLL